MQLHFNSYGSTSSPALIILHGLFGSSDNWHSFGIKFGEHFHTFALDARNHGRSPHSDVFNYQVMADDVVEFINQQNIKSVSLLGHSMGGKTAALIALFHPELIDKLIIVDIAPRSYPAHHDQIFDALLLLDVSTYDSRRDIEDVLSNKIPEKAVRQFLMKNLKRDEAGRFQWKMNLQVLKENYLKINEELPKDRKFNKPTLFIRGEKSDYIQMDDIPMINRLFPNTEIVTIKNARHWVHVNAPKEFFSRVQDFLSGY